MDVRALERPGRLRLGDPARSDGEVDAARDPGMIGEPLAEQDYLPTHHQEVLAKIRLGRNVLHHDGEWSAFHASQWTTR